MREVSNLESRPQLGKSSNERPLGIIALKMLKIGLENKGLPAGSVYIMEPQNSWAKCSMMGEEIVLIFLHNNGIFRFNTPR